MAGSKTSFLSLLIILFYIAALGSAASLGIDIINREVKFYGYFVDNPTPPLTTVVFVNGEEVYRTQMRRMSSGYYEIQIPNAFGYSFSFLEEDMPQEFWGHISFEENDIRFYSPEQQLIEIKVYHSGQEPAPNIKASSLDYPSLSKWTIISLMSTLFLVLLTLGVPYTMKSENQVDTQKHEPIDTPKSVDKSILIVAVLSFGLLMFLIVATLTWAANQLSSVNAIFVPIIALAFTLVAAVFVFRVSLLIDAEQTMAFYNQVVERIPVFGSDFVRILLRMPPITDNKDESS